MYVLNTKERFMNATLVIIDFIIVYVYCSVFRVLWPTFSPYY